MWAKQNDDDVKLTVYGNVPSDQLKQTLLEVGALAKREGYIEGVIRFVGAAQALLE